MVHHWVFCVVYVHFEINKCYCFLKRYIMIFKLMTTKTFFLDRMVF